MITALALSIFVGSIVIYLLFGRRSKPGKVAEIPEESLSDILARKVFFYQKLNPAEKDDFERRVNSFLQKVSITGIGTPIDATDKALVASSAIIPIFRFHDWEYQNINEVLLYPQTFDEQYNHEGAGRNVLGMVGTGAMNHQMILSKPALHAGFAYANGQNTGIHEFVHLIDKADGEIDGLPDYLMNRACSTTWMQLVQSKIADMSSGDITDIDAYGATNKAEFLAVISEYFFEKPERLQDEHPKLFGMLSQMFHR